MSVIFNERDVAHESAGAGVTVQRLITPDRVGSDRVLTERRHLEPGAGCDFSVSAGDLSWAHVLTGAARLTANERSYELGENHFVLLPPGLDAERSDSLGLRLVAALAHQLGGDLEVAVDGGTRFTITYDPRRAA